MIEKLNIGPTQSVATNHCIISKINELVDAVNGILAAQEQYATIYNEDIVPMLTPVNEEPVVKENVSYGTGRRIDISYINHIGPYAEQRKWIGKLCRFWNKTEYTDDLYGFLTDIVPTNKYKPEDNYFVPFKDEFGSFYEYCEPVKPDDDIIYKGDNK